MKLLLKGRAIGVGLAEVLVVITITGLIVVVAVPFYHRTKAVDSPTHVSIRRINEIEGGCLRLLDHLDTVNSWARPAG